MYMSLAALGHSLSRSILSAALLLVSITTAKAYSVTPDAARITRKPTCQGIIVPTPAGLQGHGFFPQPAALPVLSGAVILE